MAASTFTLRCCPGGEAPRRFSVPCSQATPGPGSASCRWTRAWIRARSFRHAAIDVGPRDTTATLTDRLAAVGAAAIVDALDELRRKGRLDSVPQARGRRELRSQDLARRRGDRLAGVRTRHRSPGQGVRSGAGCVHDPGRQADQDLGGRSGAGTIRDAPGTVLRADGEWSPHRLRRPGARHPRTAARRRPTSRLREISWRATRSQRECVPGARALRTISRTPARGRAVRRAVESPAVGYHLESATAGMTLGDGKERRRCSATGSRRVF